MLIMGLTAFTREECTAKTFGNPSCTRHPDEQFTMDNAVGANPRP
jgi:hypothetical protein